MYCIVICVDTYNHMYTVSRSLGVVSDKLAQLSGTLYKREMFKACEGETPR